MTHPHLCEAPIELHELLLETEDAACGALDVFVGTVRNHNEGRQVGAMTYEAHSALATRVLRELEDEVISRFGARRCRIVHRVGRLELGEASVAIVVRAPHRGDAFAGARYAIEELKKRLPVWKQEHYVDGTSDYLDGVPLERDEYDT